MRRGHPATVAEGRGRITVDHGHGHGHGHGIGRLLALVVVLAAGGAQAEERPADDEIFGGGDKPAPAEPAPASSAPYVPPTAKPAPVNDMTLPSPPPRDGDARDELNLGDPKAATRLSSDVAPEDPLKIGGQFYWRVLARGNRGVEPQDWSLTAPALIDMYMDARPNERVRAFVRGRMSYDPTAAPDGTSTGSAGDPASTLFAQPARGPSMALDQLWLSFDIHHRVFVTAGKQHVRWGTGRFWAPTDYLHMQARNPLLPFDPRTGTTMLKVHVPWEDRGWNLYGFLIPESGTATSKTGDVAAAARAEIVLGAFEAGAGVLGQRHKKAKFAADVSFGLWDLDFYGEAALRYAGEVDFVRYRPIEDLSACPGLGPLSIPDIVATYFPAERGSGWKPQVTGGVSYTRQYADKDTFTVAVEYFYNGLGYENPKAYLGLLAPRDAPLSNPATFFYLGRHYVGAFATLPAPYSWDMTTFTLSTLGNLSDRSFITRLDYSLIVLTHLRFEAYGALHYGQENGEFRMGFDSKNLSCPPPEGMGYKNPPMLYELGVGLRVAL
jgi:hypothetical protein